MVTAPSAPHLTYHRVIFDEFHYALLHVIVHSSLVAATLAGPGAAASSGSARGRVLPSLFPSQPTVATPDAGAQSFTGLLFGGGGGSGGGSGGGGGGGGSDRVDSDQLPDGDELAAVGDAVRNLTRAVEAATRGNLAIVADLRRMEAGREPSERTSLSSSSSADSAPVAVSETIEGLLTDCLTREEAALVVAEALAVVSDAATGAWNAVVSAMDRVDRRTLLETLFARWDEARLAVMAHQYFVYAPGGGGIFHPHPAQAPAHIFVADAVRGSPLFGEVAVPRVAVLHPRTARDRLHIVIEQREAIVEDADRTGAMAENGDGVGGPADGPPRIRIVADDDGGGVGGRRRPIDAQDGGVAGSNGGSASAESGGDQGEASNGYPIDLGHGGGHGGSELAAEDQGQGVVGSTASSSSSSAQVRVCGLCVCARDRRWWVKRG